MQDNIKAKPELNKPMAMAQHLNSHLDKKKSVNIDNKRTLKIDDKA
jgi:hypothetical protein